MRIDAEEAITLPAVLRQALDLRPGESVEVEQRGAKVVLAKIRAWQPPTEQEMADLRAKLQQLSGTADSGWTTDEILDMTRGSERRDPLPGEE